MSDNIDESMSEIEEEIILWGLKISFLLKGKKVCEIMQILANALSFSFIDLKKEEVDMIVECLKEAIQIMHSELIDREQRGEIGGNMIKVLHKYT